MLLFELRLKNSQISYLFFRGGGGGFVIIIQMAKFCNKSDIIIV